MAGMQGGQRAARGTRSNVQGSKEPSMRSTPSSDFETISSNRNNEEASSYEEGHGLSEIGGKYQAQKNGRGRPAKDSNNITSAGRNEATAEFTMANPAEPDRKFFEMTIKGLKTQIRALTEENKRISKESKSELAKAKKDVQVSRKEKDQSEKELRAVQAKALQHFEESKSNPYDDAILGQWLAMMKVKWKNFARDYAVDGPISTQSVAIRQKILDELVYGSYKLADQDVARSLIESGIPSYVFLTALLARLLCAQILSSPYHILSSKIDNMDNEYAIDALDMVFALCRNVDEKSAQEWRADTVRLLAQAGEGNKNSRAGLRKLAELRATVYQKVVSGVLEESAASMLLRPLSEDDAEKRARRLLHIVQETGQLSDKLWSKKSCLKIRCYEELARDKFSNVSEKMGLHPAMRCEADDTAFENMKPSLVVEPGIVGYGNEDGEKWQTPEYWSKAVIWILRDKDKKIVPQMVSKNDERASETPHSPGQFTTSHQAQQQFNSVVLIDPFDAGHHNANPWGKGVAYPAGQIGRKDVHGCSPKYRTQPNNLPNDCMPRESERADVQVKAEEKVDKSPRNITSSCSFHQDRGSNFMTQSRVKEEDPETADFSSKEQRESQEREAAEAGNGNGNGNGESDPTGTARKIHIKNKPYKPMPAPKVSASTRTKRGSSQVDDGEGNTRCQQNSNKKQKFKVDLTNDED